MNCVNLFKIMNSKYNANKRYFNWKRRIKILLFVDAAAAAKSLQSCLTLCDP